jgi:hypothetical protein
MTAMAVMMARMSSPALFFVGKSAVTADKGRHASWT